MTAARIYEQGNGFPRPGELVYESVSGTLYRVVSVDGMIHTGDARGNWVPATLTHEPRDFGELVETEGDTRVRLCRVEVTP